MCFKLSHVLCSFDTCFCGEPAQSSLFTALFEFDPSGRKELMLPWPFQYMLSAPEIELEPAIDPFRFFHVMFFHMSFHATSWVCGRMPNVYAALHRPGLRIRTALEVSWSSWKKKVKFMELKLWKCLKVSSGSGFCIVQSDDKWWCTQKKPEQNRSTESAKAVEAGMADANL